jgi:hypothetical protein
VVLGMHRSGTSLLISCLGRAGVDLGAVLNQPHPLHGHGVHEPPALALMHEDLLARHGNTPFWRTVRLEAIPLLAGSHFP